MGLPKSLQALALFLADPNIHIQKANIVLFF